MIIREFSEQDIDEITELMKILCAIKGQDFNEERWRKSIEKQMKQDNNSQVMVAFEIETNHILGMALCAVKVSDNGIRFGYISNLIVREDRRRAGIGEKIIHSIIDYLKKNHIQSIRISSKPLINKPAKGLFTKIGFEEIYRIYELKI
ncbi:MAG: GNAT family N-acetyltransferase [Candidatus Lokiarchaeota archaeon]|nr:GNAT family N-acetyltransferase [Candidatus Lokiarchaeota archaeon]